MAAQHSHQPDPLPAPKVEPNDATWIRDVALSATCKQTPMEVEPRIWQTWKTSPRPTSNLRPCPGHTTCTRGPTCHGERPATTTSCRCAMNTQRTPSDASQNRNGHKTPSSPNVSANAPLRIHWRRKPNPVQECLNAAAAPYAFELCLHAGHSTAATMLVFSWRYHDRVCARFPCTFDHVLTNSVPPGSPSVSSPPFGKYST